MKIAVLSANLGNFDTDSTDAIQKFPDAQITRIRFTDKNFPPITGLTPRLQYRIPKMFGWQMCPGFDYYLWLDGSMSMSSPDTAAYFQSLCKDIVLFRHPWRRTMQEEADHVDAKLKEGNEYITSRYKNGLHKEQLADCLSDPNFKDTCLYASTVFMYKNIPKVREMMKLWWIHTTRYYTVDQIALPYVIWKAGLDVHVIEEDLFKSSRISLTSKHK